jgi:hypothetical protein
VKVSEVGLLLACKGASTLTHTTEFGKLYNAVGFLLSRCHCKDNIQHIIVLHAAGKELTFLGVPDNEQRTQ